LWYEQETKLTAQVLNWNYQKLNEYSEMALPTKPLGTAVMTFTWEVLSSNPTYADWGFCGLSQYLLSSQIPWKYLKICHDHFILYLPNSSLSHLTTFHLMLNNLRCLYTNQPTVTTFAFVFVIRVREKWKTTASSWIQHTVVNLVFVTKVHNSVLCKMVFFSNIRGTRWLPWRVIMV
jgi:hypothetical protein